MLATVYMARSMVNRSGLLSSFVFDSIYLPATEGWQSGTIAVSGCSGFRAVSLTADTNMRRYRRLVNTRSCGYHINGNTPSSNTPSSALSCISGRTLGSSNARAMSS